MRVETFIPYALDGNLGGAYNAAMRLLGPKDYAVFMDHDVQLTTSLWYRQIVDTIAFVPEAGVLVAVANRIAPAWQQVGCEMCRVGQFSYARQLKRAEARPKHMHLPPPPYFPPPPCTDCYDIRHHRTMGTARLAHRTLLDITDTKGWGGVLFVLAKAVWREVGGFPNGAFCVDHALHFALQRTGRRSYLMEHLYVFHWRRAFGENRVTPKGTVPHCPCRLGTEVPPTVRLELPCASPTSASLPLPATAR